MGVNVLTYVCSCVNVSACPQFLENAAQGAVVSSSLFDLKLLYFYATCHKMIRSLIKFPHFYYFL